MRSCEAWQNHKGISAISPAVARHELPWVCARKIPTLKELRRLVGCERKDATRFGVVGTLKCEPKVAPLSQPWAARRNPVGIQKLAGDKLFRARREQVREVMAGGIRRETEADGAFGGFGENESPLEQFTGDGLAGAR